MSDDPSFASHWWIQQHVRHWESIGPPLMAAAHGQPSRLSGEVETYRQEDENGSTSKSAKSRQPSGSWLVSKSHHIMGSACLLAHEPTITLLGSRSGWPGRGSLTALLLLLIHQRLIPERNVVLVATIYGKGQYPDYGSHRERGNVHWAYGSAPSPEAAAGCVLVLEGGPWLE